MENSTYSTEAFDEALHWIIDTRGMGTEMNRFCEKQESENPDSAIEYAQKLGWSDEE